MTESRLCRDCGVNISNRHRLAVMCVTCSIEKYEKPKKSKKHCIDCGKQITNTLPLTVRCYHCREKKYKEERTPQRGCAAIVGLAIKYKILPKQSDQACVDCGEQAEHYDHRDYMKPLDVDAVCRKCNFKRGPGLNRDY